MKTMLVEKLMTRDVESCRAEATTADAAAIMWRRDCGSVPVTDDEGRVVGIITDRDICMALSMRGQRAADVRVGEVMAAGAIRTCSPVDDVREALEAMREGQLRRLPVVDGKDRLVGILSITDIVLHTQKGKGKKRVSRRETLATLRAICRPHGSASAGEEDSRAHDGEVHFDEIAFIVEDDDTQATANVASQEQASDSQAGDTGAGAGEALEAGARVEDGEQSTTPTKTTTRRRRRRAS
jgi:CBS domain-containing protein